LVERVRVAVVAAYAHAALPFELMVEAVKPRRDPSRTPVFQAMLTFQNAMGEAPRAPGLTIAPWTPTEAPARSDLDWYGWETGDGVAGYFVYNRELFDVSTVERWRGRLQTLLAALASAPETRLADVRFETAVLPGLRRARPATAPILP
jgi:non-ribosomal peptide synthetase component F